MGFHDIRIRANGDQKFAMPTINPHMQCHRSLHTADSSIGGQNLSSLNLQVITWPLALGMFVLGADTTGEHSRGTVLLRPHKNVISHD